MTARVDAAFEKSASRVRRLFMIMLIAIAVVLMLMLPGAQVYLGVQSLRAEAQARTALAAERLSTYAARRPDTWMYEEYRLRALGRDQFNSGAHAPLRVYMTDVSGTEIVDFEVFRNDRQIFTFTAVEEVTDGRDAVALLKAEYGLNHLAFQAAAAMLAGAAAVAVMWIAVRMSLLRLIDKALDELRGRSRILSQRVDELEHARRELALQLQAREQDHRIMARNAEALRMASDDFAHVAQISAHHLQEPLRTLLSYSQLLMRRYDSEARDDIGREYLTFIAQGVDRMKFRLRALAAYAGLRDADFTRELLDCGMVFDDVVEALKPSIAAAGASVVRDDLPMFKAPKRRLAALFEALIQNSLRRVVPGRDHDIAVTVERDDDGIVLVFTDNGIGLGAKDRDAVFGLLVHDEPGEQVLGLASARLSAFLMGGRLELCDSDIGACFKLHLSDQD